MLGKGILSGSKTYITAGLGALGAIAAYLTGEVELGTVLTIIFQAITAATVRAGIKSEVNKLDK